MGSSPGVRNSFDLPDTDENCFISESESNCAPYAAFNLLDADPDGRLTKAVFMAGLAMFDTDGDDFTTQEEFDGQALATRSHSEFWIPKTID